jgi:hypothetical protein
MKKYLLRAFGAGVAGFSATFLPWIKPGLYFGDLQMLAFYLPPFVSAFVSSLIVQRIFKKPNIIKHVFITTLAACIFWSVGISLVMNEGIWGALHLISLLVTGLWFQLIFGMAIFAVLDFLILKYLTSKTVN